MSVYQFGYFNRRDTGIFLIQEGLNGLAVEAGTHRGEFAEQLLAKWRHGRLICVDAWLDGVYPDGSAEGREGDKQAATKALSRYGDRANLWNMTSIDAAARLPDASLDYVYLDDSHEPDAVAEGIATWWPKVAPGGVLSGHDIICPGEASSGWGQYIQPIVQDFAAAKGLTIYLVPEQPTAPWSYFLRKHHEASQ